KNWTLKPQSEWVVTSCPAIVSPDIWNECNRILDEQEQKRVKPGPRPVHLLAGYIYCTCGKKMYVYQNNMVFKCQTCKNRIVESDIEEIYHDQLKTFLLTD